MSKKILFIFGCIFMLTSGLIYTVENFIRAYCWANALKLGISTTSDSDRTFTCIFFIIGIVIFIFSLLKKE